MLNPVLVNLGVLNPNGHEVIVAAVMDLHYTKIKRLINTPDGMTMMVTDDDLAYKLLIPFKEMYNIYNAQHKIDDAFEDEVHEYYKNNYGNGETN